jgi:hypothetical protein
MQMIHVAETVSVTVERTCEEPAVSDAPASEPATALAHTITAAREAAKAELRREIASLGGDVGLDLRFETTWLETARGLRVAVTAHATPCQLKRVKQQGAESTSSAPQWSFGIGVGFIDVE